MSNISESMRAMTAHEARFRIDAPNSSSRRIVAIGLEERDREIECCRAQHAEPNIHFIEARATDDQLRDALEPADIIMVTGEDGDDPLNGFRAADFCRERGRLLVCVIRASDTHSTSDLLRSVASMTVLVNGDGYLNDLIDMLGVR